MFIASHMEKRRYSLPRLSLRKFLINCPRDRPSGIPNGLGSLALRYFLPVYEIERNIRLYKENIMKKMQTDGELSAYIDHYTGSSAEGLSVPTYTLRVSGPRDKFELEEPSLMTFDMDIMAEVKGVLVGLSEDESWIYIDRTRASHVGYTRIVLSLDHNEPEEEEQCGFPFIHVEEEDGETVWYLSNQAYTSVEFTQEARARYNVAFAGPAINCQTEGVFPSDMDFVPALALSRSPFEFSEWLVRVSTAEWPLAGVREDIAENSRFFLVGVGHASSPRREVEWRFSFSDPEKRLALSLTLTQIKVYLLLKLIQKCFLKEPKVLVTFHLKTLMFWELEATSAEEWQEDKVFERFVGLLDRVIACLENRYIPNYFMPKNNLIIQASTNHVAATLETVLRIRQNPLEYVLGADDRVQFHFSTAIPLRILYQSFLSAVDDDRDLESVVNCFREGLLEHAGHGLVRNILTVATRADLLQDIWECSRLEDLNLKVEVHEHFNWSEFSWKVTLALLEKYENDWLDHILGTHSTSEIVEATSNIRWTKIEETNSFVSLLCQYTSEEDKHARSSTLTNIVAALMRCSIPETPIQPLPTVKIAEAINQTKHEHDERCRDIDLTVSYETRDSNGRQFGQEHECEHLLLARKIKLQLVNLSLTVVRSSVSQHIEETLKKLGAPEIYCSFIQPVVMEQYAAVEHARSCFSNRPDLCPPENFIGELVRRQFVRLYARKRFGVSAEQLRLAWVPGLNGAGVLASSGLTVEACRRIALFQQLSIIDGGWLPSMMHAGIDMTLLKPFLKALPVAVCRVLTIREGRITLAALTVLADYACLMWNPCFMERVIGISKNKQHIQMMLEPPEGCDKVDRVILCIVDIVLRRILSEDDWADALQNLRHLGGNILAFKVAWTMRRWNPDNSHKTNTCCKCTVI